MSKVFDWGVATSSYQIEGAYAEDGRGLSIWDTFTHDGKCKDGHTGDVACDHYHRFEEDVALMAELGVTAYRFSISWTRILPDGVGRVNEAGVDFYNRLIDCLLAHGITPYITLFHWDYPYELEKRGAWRNPKSPDWFENYARVIFERFADRVKYFITFNEPQCIVGLGYRDGGHAPGLKMTDRDTVLIAHRIMLAHGKAVRKLREIAPDCKIGYAPCSGSAIPYSETAEDIAAAKQYYFDVDTDRWVWSVAWWSDPIMLGRYPTETSGFAALKQYLPADWEEDLKIISEPIDFYCQNIYAGDLIRSDGNNGAIKVPHPIETARNSLDWYVVPKSLYWGPKFLYERYGKPVVISENGMCCHDTVSTDGKVHDPNRIDFMDRYLAELQKCRADGTDVRGYFYWSFMDNFEWAIGYTPRFGLTYIDYETQKRIPKDSFYHYRDYIAKQKNSD